MFVQGRFPGVAIVVFSILGLGASVSAQPPDFQWTFNNNGFLDYTLTSVSSSELFDGALPVNDPTINLRVGKRYRVTVVNFGPHPFEVIAKGATAASDVVLLAQSGNVGSFEADSEVAWSDDGAGHVAFTVTQNLVAAMNAPNLIPGYRCGVHASTMRGDFFIFGGGTKIDDPIPDLIAKGDVTIELETVMDGLTAPLGLVTPDDGTSRMFVYDQAGQVRLILDGVPQPTPFLDASDRLTTLGVAGPGSFDERGFIGFALHPDFASNPRVYTYTSEPPAGLADFTTSPPLPGDPNHQAVFAEWTVDAGNPNAVDTSTRRELLRIDEPQFNHDGGTMRFGPDGYLYIALGDGGAGDDQGDGHGPNGNGQRKNTIYGSLLRIDVDGNNAANGQYGIPADNPFVGTDGIDEIYAYGLRNPFMFSFDSVTGDLYVADVGQNDIEELNVVTKGGNYGWRLKEGSFFFDPNGTEDGFVTTIPVAPIPPGLLDPIAEYDHDEGRSIIGGFVYHGAAIPALQGRYVTGDFGTDFGAPSGRLFFLDDANQFVEFRIGNPDRPLGLWLKGFGEDRDGEIYVLGSEELGPFGATGKVLKIVPPPVTSVNTWTFYR